MVMAEDYGGWKTSTKVLVNVEDINDNPPKFSPPVIVAYVPENCEKGQLFIIYFLFYKLNLLGILLNRSLKDERILISAKKKS